MVRERLPRAALLVVPVVLTLGAGCAPSLATMQPAHVAPKGHVQATAALEVGIPTGTIGTIIDTGKKLSDIAQHAHEPDAGSGTPALRFGRDRGRQPAVRRLPLRGLLLADRSVRGRPPLRGRRLARRRPLPAAQARDRSLRHDDRRAASRTPRSRSRWRHTSRCSRSTTSRAGRSTCRCRSAPRAASTGSGAGRSFSTRTSHGDAAFDPGVDTPDLASFEGHTLYYGGQGGFAIGYRYIFVASS